MGGMFKICIYKTRLFKDSAERGIWVQFHDAYLLSGRVKMLTPVAEPVVSLDFRLLNPGIGV